MQQIIQLRADDEIASIRSRIETAELSHVVLVVPRGCWALASDRGLQLVRRAAEDAGVQVGLVAHDYDVRERAAAFGFPLFASVMQAQSTHWHMGPVEREPTQGAPRRINAPGRAADAMLPADRMRQWWGLVALGIVAAFALCIVGVVFVPAANVHIVPASIALSVATDVSVDPSVPQINLDTRAIPARRVTREISGTLSAKTTTEKSIPNAPSTGTVIFSNMRAEQTIIPQGTIVKTTAAVPIRFTTVTTGTLPAAINSRAEVPIQALDPGPVGNVKELAINAVEGSLAIGVRVINTKPTASGTNKPVKVVTAADKDKLETQLLQQMRQQGNALLQKDLKPGETMPLESVLLDVSSEVFDHVVDDPADTLNLRITADVFGLAVDKAEMESLIGTLLKKQMPAGYQLLPNGVSAELLPGKYQGIALKGSLRGVGYATPQVNTARLTQGLQGKAAEEAVSYLQSTINLAQPADISITPMGWNRMPWLGFRIAVFVEPQAVGKK